MLTHLYYTEAQISISKEFFIEDILDQARGSFGVSIVA